MDRADLAFIRCMDRLEHLIERETDALKFRAPLDFDEFNRRKTHALLEFLRMSRNVPDQKSDAVAARVAQFREKLSENALTLDQHLRAMVEIASIMIKSIEAEESDGTYSARPDRRR
jgi:hypothetical protein